MSCDKIENTSKRTPTTPVKINTVLKFGLLLFLYCSTVFMQISGNVLKKPYIRYQVTVAEWLRRVSYEHMEVSPRGFESRPWQTFLLILVSTVLIWEKVYLTWECSFSSSQWTAMPLTALLCSYWWMNWDAAKIWNEMDANIKIVINSLSSIKRLH